MGCSSMACSFPVLVGVMVPLAQLSGPALLLCVSSLVGMLCSAISLLLLAVHCIVSSGLLLVGVLVSGVVGLVCVLVSSVVGPMDGMVVGVLLLRTLVGFEVVFVYRVFVLVVVV